MLLLIGVAVDRLMCWYAYRRVYCFGYEVQDSGIPFDWQDNIGSHLLFEPSYELLWSYRPGVHLRLRFCPQFGAARVYDFHTNSLGLREREFAQEKPLGSVRIFCMGDSCTAGCGLPLAKAYPRQLQCLLRRRFRNEHIDVFNSGADGYTSFQGKQLLKSRLLACSPDVVIAAFSCNDDSQRPQSDQAAQRGLSRTAVGVQRLLLKSPLLMMLAGPILSAKHRVSSRHGRRQSGRTVRVSASEYVQNLTEMCEMARGKGTEMVLLRLPRYVYGQMEPCSRAEAMARVAREQRVGLVDMLPEFVARLRDGALLHFDWIHPNARGHQLIAEGLAAFLAEDEAFRRRLAKAGGCLAK